MWRLLCIAVLHMIAKSIRPLIWSGGLLSTVPRFGCVIAEPSIGLRLNPWKYRLSSDLQRTQCYDVIGRNHITWQIKPRSTSTPCTWFRRLPSGNRPKSLLRFHELHQICFWWPSSCSVASLSRPRRLSLTESSDRWWTTTISVFLNLKLWSQTIRLARSSSLFGNATQQPRSVLCQRTSAESQKKHVRHLPPLVDCGLLSSAFCFLCAPAISTCRLPGVPNFICY